MRFGAGRIGPPPKEEVAYQTMDTMPDVKTETELQSQLSWLKSRLAQGQRDHQRSRDDLQRLKGEIRQIEGELRTFNGDRATTLTR
jgi:chromosome segregation ATPase